MKTIGLAQGMAVARGLPAPCIRLLAHNEHISDEFSKDWRQWKDADIAPLSLGTI